MRTNSIKTQAELREWSAKKIAEGKAKEAAEAAKNNLQSTASQSIASGNSLFFTGKPYIADLESYAFRFRTYDPELQRWTTEDPSGFPDGPNASFYAPTPTSMLDWMGLYEVSFTLLRKMVGSDAYQPFTGGTAILSITQSFYMRAVASPYSQASKTWMNEQFENNASPYISMQLFGPSGFVRESQGPVWNLYGFDASTGGAWNIREGFPLYVNGDANLAGGRVEVTVNYQNKQVFSKTISLVE